MDFGVKDEKKLQSVPDSVMSNLPVQKSSDTKNGRNVAIQPRDTEIQTEFASESVLPDEDTEDIIVNADSSDDTISEDHDDTHADVRITAYGVKGGFADGATDDSGTHLPINNENRNPTIRRDDKQYYFDELDDENLTPGMKQYLAVKREYPDYIVMFRMGDFYEMFYEDAKTAARELNIVLTSRGKDEKKAPLAGIPFHSIEPYLAKLVKHGFKVVIAEQIEDPKLAKGLVKRSVTRVITPGTITEANMLEEKQNNFIASISNLQSSSGSSSLSDPSSRKDDPKKQRFGISISDVSTGEFYSTCVTGSEELSRMLSKFSPSEIILPYAIDSSPVIKDVMKSQKSFVNVLDDRFYLKVNALDVLNRHFIKDDARKSYNDFLFELGKLQDKTYYDLAISSAGSLLSYLKKTQLDSLAFLSNIEIYRDSTFMVLDSATIRNLELLKNIVDGSERGTMVGVLDKTVTSMGARFLRKCITMPLMNIREINARHDSVETIIRSPMEKSRLRDNLKQVNDIERLVSRIGTKRCGPRDILALRNTLRVIPKVNVVLSELSSDKVQPVQSKELFNQKKDLSLLMPFYFSRSLESLSDMISRAIREDPPAIVRDGGVIRKGFNDELDVLIDLRDNAQNHIIRIEESERQKTGIKSLKVKYNRVFGYFIEIPNGSLSMVPPEYTRKQTMANCERFVTEELKNKEREILDSEERSKALEESIFFDLVSMINKESSELQELSRRIAYIDFLQSLATVAVDNNYSRPAFNNDNKISIVNGRHPVVEQIEENFVSNNCVIDEGEMIILTGPNMAGKSTYLRQNAIIVIMSQLGSFVPATSATVCIVDRVFTRVGAHDDLSTGKSTFMVEMSECANILANATSKSLIILDEVGRGTSTFDGVSIAWSIAEYIYNKIKAKTLFATHYHVLNKLSESFKKVTNYNMAVDEERNEIIFLRKVIKGGTDKSYGIHVAKLAGLPLDVIDRANEVQDLLIREDEMIKKIKANKQVEQKTLFDLMNI